MDSVSSLVSNFMGSIWYWLVGIIFFCFRKKLLGRYGEVFFKDYGYYTEDHLFSYIKCGLLIVSVYLIILDICYMFSGNISSIWYELWELLVYIVIALSIAISLLFKSEKFNILLMAPIITLFLPPLLILLFIKKGLSLPDMPSNAYSETYGNKSGSVSGSVGRQKKETSNVTIHNEAGAVSGFAENGTIYNDSRRVVGWIENGTIYDESRRITGLIENGTIYNDSRAIIGWIENGTIYDDSRKIIGYIKY